MLMVPLRYFSALATQYNNRINARFTLMHNRAEEEMVWI